jgi:hypothetical protein
VKLFIVFLLIIVGGIVSYFGVREQTPTAYAIGACALIVATAGLQTKARDEDKDAVWIAFALVAAFLTFIGLAAHW